jgi:phosphoribulokinase
VKTNGRHNDNADDKVGFVAARFQHKVDKALLKHTLSRPGPLKMSMEDDIKNMMGPVGTAANWDKKAATALKATSGGAAQAGKVTIIGVAADSGCGKSTFMRRLTGIFGGEKVGLLGGGHGNGGWETNTLVSDSTTVMCLDDYHLNDRAGRKVTGLTALNVKENNFDLMYEQLKDLKAGKTIKKPIYNHVNGTLDTPEEIVPTPIMIVEGLHPMVDERVRDLLDFSLYLDITDDVKFAWKVQRDMIERGWSREEVEKSINDRKPDFDAYVSPQRAQADVVIQVLPTSLTDDKEGKILKVKFIQRDGKKDYDPVFMFEEGKPIEWTPEEGEVKSAAPGVKFAYGRDTFMDQPVTVLEMDGKIENVQDLANVEKHLGNAATKKSGELTEQMVKNADAPGSFDGTGFFQTLAAFKIREFYEKVSGKA